MSGKIKFGKVSYKNTLPLFYRLNVPFAEFVEGTPSQLARKISVGLLKGGILSSLYYLQNRERFVLVPDISISSFGKTLSVLIVSEKPLKEIRSLTPSGESLTSNFLVYAIFNKFLGQRVEFAPQGEAFIVIGDRALEGNFRGRYVYDVGQLWKSFSGLPAVYALFIVPKDWALNYPQHFATLSLALAHSRDSFFKELDTLPIEEKLKKYFRSLDYRFREEHLESLKLMEKLLRELG